jgi:hypothetical protein
MPDKDFSQTVEIEYTGLDELKDARFILGAARIKSDGNGERL